MSEKDPTTATHPEIRRAPKPDEWRLGTPQSANVVDIVLTYGAVITGAFSEDGWATSGGTPIPRSKVYGWRPRARSDSPTAKQPEDYTLNVGPDQHPTRDAVRIDFEIPGAVWISGMTIPLACVPELIGRLQDVEGMGAAYREGENARANGAAKDRNPYDGRPACSHQFRCYEWAKGWEGDGEPFFRVDRELLLGEKRSA
jgi:hypothetical protein